MSYNTDKSRELTAQEAVRALLYGVDGLITKVSDAGTRASIRRVRTILLGVKSSITEGIKEGTEVRC
jgi:hypothetical protein